MINQYGNKMTPAAQNLYIGKKKTSMPNTTILIPPPRRNRCLRLLGPIGGILTEKIRYLWS